MKKWIIHIIYRFLHVIFAWLMGDRIRKTKDENEKNEFDLIIVRVVYAGVVLVFACLWRESVFRCGSTALIYYKGCKRIHEYSSTGPTCLKENIIISLFKTNTMKRYILGILAVIIISAASAFTLVKTNNGHKHKVLTTWYFDGTSAQIKDASHWRNTGTAPSDCQSMGNRPCSINVDASDQSELQDYLDPLTAGQITSQSAQKRP
jgi:hypothetical protein